MALPLKLDWGLAQNKWKSQIDPVLANPLNGITILSGISLVNGVTTINHGLQQMQRGWIIVDQQGPANIYRSQPFNALTLTLTSSAAVVVSIGVY